ncbi:protein phosphatase 2C 51-like [Gastrolobium bilobum]|uniref:protein phosphatase 2C 51-like n=1 Tax=Gastrolobium bilobum TaxID=150636 RepID=UPI002AAF9CE3|nr:protein phosphatase 2C 51-like [Gastrolobium bilobum]
MKNSKRHSPQAAAQRRVASDSVETITRLKNARRRRLEFRRMKYTCQARIHVGNGSAGGTHPPEATKVVDWENEKREIHESVEISLSLAMSSPSSEEEDRSSARNDAVLSYGSVSMMGSRKEMEDAVSVEIGFAAKDRAKCDFFAVYDGHGGAQVAKACRERLHRMVAEEVERCGVRSGNEVKWDWEGVMEGCFVKMDREVADYAAAKTVGSTAVVAVVTMEEVVVANCGDCRAVMGRGGEAVNLSNDHKPDRPDELMRIEEAGGRVINWNGHRVLGVLSTSRSIGDHYLRPYVISKPEVTVTKRTSKDEFLILASDGLWDVISSEAACQVVRKCLNGQIRRVCHGVGNQTRAAEAAALLAEIALAKGSRDNTSVIVVELRGTTTSS